MDPIQAPEAFADLTFPLAGIDLSDPFWKPEPSQMPSGNYGRCTPAGVNVRGYEPTTNKARGGSRQGLVKYVSGVVVASWIIQELNVIVTTDDSAEA